NALGENRVGRHGGLRQAIHALDTPFAAFDLHLDAAAATAREYRFDALHAGAVASSTEDEPAIIGHAYVAFANEDLAARRHASDDHLALADGAGQFDGRVRFRRANTEGHRHGGERAVEPPDRPHRPAPLKARRSPAACGDSSPSCQARWPF